MNKAKYFCPFCFYIPIDLSPLVVEIFLTASAWKDPNPDTVYAHEFPRTLTWQGGRKQALWKSGV